VTCDGRVDINDLAEIGRHWSAAGLDRPTSVPAPSALPLSSSLALSPSSLSAPAGSQVTLEVVLDSSAPIRGAQFGLAFDPHIVQVDSVQLSQSFASWAAAHGTTVNQLPGWSIDNTGGTVAVSALMLGGGSGQAAWPTGALPLATVILHGLNGASADATTVRVTGAALVADDPNGGSSLMGAPQKLGAAQLRIEPPAAAPRLAAAAVQAAAAPNPVQVSLTPGTNQVNMGDSFTIDVGINIDQVTQGFQFGLAFDSTVVHVVSVTQGTFYSDFANANPPAFIFSQPWTIDNNAGVASAGALAIINGPPTGGPSGSGVVAHVLLSAVGNGQTTLQLQNVAVTVLNANGQPVHAVFQTTDAQIQVGPNAGPSHTPTSSPTSTPTPTQSPTPTSTTTPTVTPTPTITPTITPTLVGTPFATVLFSPALAPNKFDPGDEDTISIGVNTNQVVSGLHFGLSVSNPAALQVESVEPGAYFQDWLTGLPSTTTPAPSVGVTQWTIHNDTGVVDVGGLDALNPPAAGPAGPTGRGFPVNVKLKGLANASGVTLSITNLSIVGSDHQTLQNVSVADPIAFTIGAPTSTPTATPTPTLSPTPVNVGTLSVVSNSFQQVVGDTFDVKLNLNLSGPGGSSNSFSKGINFSVQFDPAVVDFVQAVPGPFYQDWVTQHPGDPHNPASVSKTPPFAVVSGTPGKTTIGGFEVIGDNTPDAGPTGSGVVASIRFKVKALGQFTLGIGNVAVNYALPGGGGNLNLPPGTASYQPATISITAGATNTPTPGTQTPTATTTRTPTSTVTPTVTVTPTLTPSPTFTLGVPATATQFVAANPPTATVTATLGSSSSNVGVSPTTQTVNVGDTVHVDLAIHTDVKARGVQFGIKFDPSILQVVPVDASLDASQQVALDEQSSPFFDDFANSSQGIVSISPPFNFDNQGGTIALGSITVLSVDSNSQSQTGSTTGASGDGVLAHLIFKAKAPGTSPITFDSHLGGIQAVVLNGIDFDGKSKPVAGVTTTGGEVVVVGAGTPIATTTTTLTTTATPGTATATPSPPSGVATSTPIPSGAGGAVNLQSTGANAGLPNSPGGASVNQSSAQQLRSGSSPSGQTAGSGAAPSAAGPSAPGGGGAAAAASSAQQRAGTGPQTSGGPQAIAPGDTTGVGDAANPAGDVTNAAPGTGPSGPVSVAGAGAARPGAAVGGGGNLPLANGTLAGQLLATIELTSVIDERGIAHQPITYSDPGHRFNLLIPAGTTALDSDHRPLRSVAVYQLDDHPVVPDDQSLVGSVVEFEPSGATFDPPIRVSVGYEATSLPDGYSDADVGLAYFDGSKNNWVILDGVAEPSTAMASASVAHFSSFGVLTRPPDEINWARVAGILAIEMGLALAAYVYIVRRRDALPPRVAAILFGSSADADEGDPADPADSGTPVAAALPPPPAASTRQPEFRDDPSQVEAT
jgi:hypothetical protein